MSSDAILQVLIGGQQPGSYLAFVQHPIEKFHFEHIRPESGGLRLVGERFGRDPLSLHLPLRAEIWPDGPGKGHFAG